MRSIKLIRIPLTVFLGLLVLFDLVLGYRLWWYGFPKNVTVIREGQSERMLIDPVAFTSFDWVVLTLMVTLHGALIYTVWRSWRPLNR
jgi:fumarate reductase subunit C